MTVPNYLMLYPAENLKELTQQKSGNGAGVKVGNGSDPIPNELWNFVFLKNEDNKSYLYSPAKYYLEQT